MTFLFHENLWNSRIKHISKLDISSIWSLCVWWIHVACKDWLFSHFIGQWFTLSWHTGIGTWLMLKDLDWLNGLVTYSSDSIGWSAFSKQWHTSSWTSSKDSILPIYCQTVEEFIKAKDTKYPITTLWYHIPGNIQQCGGTISCFSSHDNKVTTACQLCQHPPWGDYIHLH